MLVASRKWWELYREPELNDQEEKPNVSNQNIAQSFQNFTAVRAQVKQARASYYPTVTVEPPYTRARSSGNASGQSIATSSARAGQLSERATSGQFKGTYAEIVKGMNTTLDAIILPLNHAAGMIDQISKGDIPVLITEVRHGDFNTIKDNLNALMVAMNDMTTAAEKIANGDLTITIRERSPHDKLMQALSSMVGGLVVRTIAGEVDSASQSIITTSVEVSNGASVQAASAEKASSSVEQMVSNIKQNADNAQQTNKIATKSAKDAQESGKSVLEAVSAMKEIARSRSSKKLPAKPTCWLSTPPSKRHELENMARALPQWLQRFANWQNAVRRRRARSISSPPPRGVGEGRRDAR